MEQQLALTERTADVQPMDPMQMIQRAFNVAIERGDGLAVVDRILEQQKWMIQHNEEEAFNAALRRIQDKLKPIAKRGKNPETHSSYAEARDIDAEIQSLLQTERMTLSFEPESHPQPDMVRIVGILSLGAYSRRYPLDMPADGKGAKGGGVMSRTHATGSAITYGKRYLKNMIFDLQFKEPDDDGNRAGGGAGVMDEKDHINHLDNIRNAPTHEELGRLFNLALEAASKVGDTKSTLTFEREKNLRWRALKGGK